MKYGVTMTRTYNGEALGNVSPHYTWTFDQEKIKLTNQDYHSRKLGETQPVAIGAPPGFTAWGRGVCRAVPIRTGLDRTTR